MNHKHPELKKREQIAVRIPKDLLMRVRLEAVRSDQHIQSVIESALEKHLPKHMSILVKD